MQSAWLLAITAFAPPHGQPPRKLLPRRRHCPPPQLNVFDNVKQVVDGVTEAFADDEYCPEGFVRASHILFLEADGDATAKASALKARIVSGEFSFGEAATAFSSCPTRDLQGKLGVFQSLSRLTEGTLRGDSMPYDGQNTSSFDAVLFSEALGVIHLVSTQWGTHLLLIDERGAGAPPDDLMAKSFEAGVDKAAGLVQQAMGGKHASPGKEPTGSGFGGSGKGKAKRRKKR